MSRIVVIVPTRERPDNALQMAHSFRETAALFASELVLVVDRTDPCLAEYKALPARPSLQTHSSGALWPPDPVRIIEVTGGSLTKATNEAAERIWNDDCIIGHIGDDHRFETKGWDTEITEALREPGIAYGDDGFWGERLPTAAFISSIIPRTLGWYALPTSNHYGIDDAWGDLGRGLGRLRYLPDIRIIQPGPGETAQNGDDVFWKAQEKRHDDEVAYYSWRDGGELKADLARLRAVLG